MLGLSFEYGSNEFYGAFSTNEHDSNELFRSLINSEQDSI